MRHIYILKQIFFTLITLLCTTLSSCSSTDLVDKVSVENNDSQYLSFSVVVPKETKITRAMSESDTYSVDFKTFKALLFSEGKFVEECKLVSYTEIDADRTMESKYKIVVKVPEKEMIADLLFLVNSPIQEATKGQSLDEYLAQNTFDTVGNWDIKGGKKIPMSGILKDYVINTNKKQSQLPTVPLLRALARVDLVINSTVSLKESFEFDFKEAIIYNSSDKGLLSPILNNIADANTSVKAVSIPNNIGYNDLIVVNLKNVDNYISNSGIALLSESDITNPVFMILKASINKSTEDYYYRVDFHSKSDLNGYNIIPLLRNHKYIVSIKRVTGYGYKSINDAIKGPSSNIDAEVISWDENIDNGFVVGKKYFGINTTAVFFESYTKEQEHYISFQSNLSKDELLALIKGVSWTYNKDLFDLVLDYDGQKFIIKTKTNNISHDVLEDEMKIRYGKYEIPIKITQNYDLPEYRVACDVIKVNGLYQVNTELNESNTVNLQIISKSDLSSYNYSIETDIIDNIQFKGNGVFKSELSPSGMYEANIILYGSGKPKSISPKVYTLKTNSKVPTACTIKVNMAYTPKLVVGFDTSKTRGAVFNQGTRGSDSHDFLMSEYNFGLNDSSTVKIAPFSDYTFNTSNKPSEVYNAITSMFENGNSCYMFVSRSASFESVITGKHQGGIIPDIVVVGGSYTLTAARAKLLTNYILAGGCVFMLEGAKSTIQRLFANLYNVNVKSAGDGLSRAVYRMENMVSDPVYSGPFGSLNNSYWASPDATTDAVLDLPLKEIVVYTGNVPVSYEDYRAFKGATMLRTTRHNVVFIATDNFLTSDDKNARYPFSIDELGRPLEVEYNARGINSSNATTYYNINVHNSKIAANIMAYLIDQAEFDGVNSDY